MSDVLEKIAKVLKEGFVRRDKLSEDIPFKGNITINVEGIINQIHKDIYTNPKDESVSLNIYYNISMLEEQIRKAIVDIVKTQVKSKVDYPNIEIVFKEFGGSTLIGFPNLFTSKFNISTK